jgi:hypothetical protein
MDVSSYEQFFEFVFIGVVLGVVEDLIALYFVTDGAISISWEMIGIVTLVAIPFAAFSELIIDD